MIDHVGTQAAKTLNGTCPFPSLHIASRGLCTLVFEGHSDLEIANVTPKELFMMLPTELLPYLSNDQHQSLVDVIKSNPVDIMEFGLKGIAGSISKDKEEAENLFMDLLTSLKKLAGSKLQEPQVDPTTCSNLIFFARFSAYVEAHFSLTKHVGEEARCIPESDAWKALELFRLMCDYSKN
jgi:hypothetical protein